MAGNAQELFAIEGYSWGMIQLVAILRQDEQGFVIHSYMTILKRLRPRFDQFYSSQEAIKECSSVIEEDCFYLCINVIDVLRISDK